VTYNNCSRLPPATIWIDVEDLFEYAEQQARPSGIQRVEYELGRALSAGDWADRVRFVRHDTKRRTFRAVSWDSVERLFMGFSTPPPPARAAAAPAEQNSPWRAGRHGLKKLVYRLPLTVRHPLLQSLLHQRRSLYLMWRMLRAAAVAIFAMLRRRRRPIPSAPEDFSGPRFEESVKPGDVLAVIGSPWFHPDYAGLVGRAQRAHGMCVMLLIYDIIPLRRPEWCDRHLVHLFTTWFRDIAPLSDVILTISRASAADVRGYAERTGLALRCHPRPIPMGSGFRGWGATAVLLRPLPAPRSYALLVSTIEARKNHILLLHVWRHLLESMPHDRVPTLVFAGRVGWLVDDLMQQLENAAYLDGKIVHVDSPTDAELELLYAGCLFTLFPSFYEGWGLPVSESLAFGRPCIISNATSLPEAGGALARYFDPENVADATRVIRAVIEAPDQLAAWEARIAGEFKPTPWEKSAEAILAACQVTTRPSGATIV
jgi:glycosyltransferase involved in cell wall biosynthesis